MRIAKLFSKTYNYVVRLLGKPIQFYENAYQEQGRLRVFLENVDHLTLVYDDQH